MKESQNHYANRKDKEEKDILYASIYIKFQKMKTHLHNQEVDC